MNQLRHIVLSPVCAFVMTSSLLAFITNCGGDTEPAKDPTVATVTNPQDTMQPPVTTTATTAAMPPPVATTPAEPPPPAPQETWTDDQVLGAIHTANAGEIEQAKLAKSKAKDKMVKNFADMMMKHHTEADKKALEIGKKNKWEMTASPSSTALEADAKNTTSSLSSQAAPAFDKAYIDAQVKEHEAVLELIDKKLMPNAKGTEVKAYVDAVRTKVAAHLKDAKDIQGKLK